MSLNPLAIYKGVVSHSRFSPTKHAFKYKVFQICLDIKQPSLVDNISRFWSTGRFNLVRFKRHDYMPSERSLYDEVCQQIHCNTGEHFDGDVYLLTNLRYWGHCYNPASFYACYKDSKLRYFICEVKNTPWGERFSYVHNIDDITKDDGDMHEAHFDKQFHVSPFMPMNLKYQWKYKISAGRIHVLMNLTEDNKPVFNANLNLTGEVLTSKQANWLPFKYPVMCLKTMLAIYWQALRLWLKKVPIFAHPNSHR